MLRIIRLLIGQVIRFSLLGLILMGVFRLAGNELPFINAFVIAFIGDTVIQTTVLFQRSLGGRKL